MSCQGRINVYEWSQCTGGVNSDSEIGGRYATAFYVQTRIFKVAIL